MPTLDWIGKQAVVNHHKDVPYRLLHCNGELSVGDPDSGNLLVQGDNLEALKALLPYYRGQVKCIYIDPPYNTGNENWKYNDNVNSPEIRQWLKKTVGKEGEDLSRHDKWLCMMYPRLKLLHEILSEDGIIIVHIDDNEESNLRFLLNEIFLRSNFLSNLIWDLGTGTTAGHFTRSHEYIAVYAKNKDLISNFKTEEEGLIRHGALKRISDKNPPSTINFPAGIEFEGDNATFQGTLGGSETQEIIGSELVFENGQLKYPVKIRAGWAIKNQIIQWLDGQETYDTKGQKVSKIYFNKSGIVSYEKEKSVTNPKTVLNGFGSTKTGTNLVKSILDDVDFDYPKPLHISEFLISLCTQPDALILDSFSGTGTTAHGVLSANTKDGGSRKFILVEMKEDIAEDITAKRIRRVIEGYNAKGDPKKPVKGLGGGFRYCTLGTPLFNEYGDINQEVSFPDLAAHIFFSETGSPLPKRVDGTAPFIGQYQNRLIYLLFSAVNQGFAREAAQNVLTPDRLSALPDPPDRFSGATRVVYAEGCTVTDEHLAECGVVFKQIPYQIEGV